MRIRIAAPAAALVLLLAAPASAQGNSDRSPKWGSAELGAGTVTPLGDVVQDVYGEDTYDATVHGRVGVLLFSIVDLGVSADFAQLTGRRIGAGGAQSAEITRLTLIPLTATGILRLDVLKNQWIVPYGGAGAAYLVWSERNPAADAQVDGDKYGWTALGGVQILLDVLEPSRAADLDGWWGVNDTYLNLEVSKTSYDRFGRGVEGLDLSHWAARASFMFEF